MGRRPLFFDLIRGGLEQPPAAVLPGDGRLWSVGDGPVRLFAAVRPEYAPKFVGLHDPRALTWPVTCRDGVDATCNRNGPSVRPDPLDPCGGAATVWRASVLVASRDDRGDPAGEPGRRTRPRRRVGLDRPEARQSGRAIWWRAMSEAGTSAVSGLLSTKTVAPVKGADSNARSAEHLRGERGCRSRGPQFCRPGDRKVPADAGWP